MSNKSLFVRALEEVQDVEAKLTQLNAKFADMRSVLHRAPVTDPLDNPQLGGATSSARGHTGGNIGKLVGGLGGAALGGWAGSEIGGLAGLSADVLAGAGNVAGVAGGLGSHALIGTPIPTDAPMLSGNMVSGLGGAIAGGLGGAYLGKRIGAGIGKMTATPEEQMAEHIRRLDPASGLAHLRMLERSGKVAPSVLQSGKDAYNTRRDGLRTQLEAGVR